MTRRALAATVGAVVLLLGVGWIVLSRLPDEMCGNAVLDEVRSPDGAFRLVAFQRDCGATTGFSTQVSLLEAEEALPYEGGNLFISDTNHGAAPSGPGGGPDVRMRWDGPGRVTLEHDVAARVFRCEARLEGVEVTCERRFRGN